MDTRYAESHRKCPYAPHYCEENVWKLLADDFLPAQECYVIFITNVARACALWHQRASSRIENPVYWDYHVIIVRRCKKTLLVYDLDTILLFPYDLDKYLYLTLGNQNEVKIEHRSQCKIIPAEIYLNEFWSDRKHMLRDDGSWYAAPPPWSCILPQGPRITLDELLDLNNLRFPCMSAESLVSHFSG